MIKRDNLALSLFFDLHPDGKIRLYYLRMTRYAALLLLFCSRVALSQLDMVETREMRLVVIPNLGYRYILPHAEKSFLHALEFHKTLFDYTPSEKITLFVQDFGDFGNGGATAVPKNAISIGLSPFSYAFETSPAGDRIYTMMNHELVHIIALDNTTSTDRFYHSLFFGKVLPSKDNPLSVGYAFLTTPRRYAPRWYHEGIASYVETWMAGGIGLATGSYDEMNFRTRVLEKTHIFSAQGLESEGTTTDFQGKSNSYLYGTRFMSYLSYQYGPEKLIEWAKRKDGSRRMYNSQFKQVFKKSLTRSWDEWIQFENQWQEKNIATIRQTALTPPQPITDKILGSVSYPHFDKKRNKIYVAVNYPGQVPHLAAIHLADGHMEKLTDIKGAALFYVSSVTYDEQHDIIYFTTDNDTWRDLNSYDVSTGKVSLLKKDSRTGDLAFNKADQSIWGIRHENGISTIVRMPKENPKDPHTPYSSWEQRYTLRYGYDIFDIDVSPDGTKLTATVTDRAGNQSLLIFPVDKLVHENKHPSADTLINIKNTSPQSFRFTSTGDHLYGTLYQNGVSNIKRVDVATRENHTVTHVLTGLFRPIPAADSKLFAFSFTSNGFQPVYVKETPEDIQSPSIAYLGKVTREKYPVLKQWELPIGAEKAIKLDSTNSSKGKYKPSKLLSIQSAYPILVGYKNFVGVGYTVNLGDPLGFREFDFTFAYSPSQWKNTWSSEADSTNLVIQDDEQFHFSMAGKLGNYSFTASYNQASFYDLFGPTRISRRGVNARVQYARAIYWDPPRRLEMTLGLGGFYGLEKSPYFQQVETTGYDASLFYNLDGLLSYVNMKSSLGAVDQEKGLRTTLRASSAFSAGRGFPSLFGTLDYGFQLPINHFSIWLRTAVGKSFSPDLNPFTRFGFAAFGNNYVDYQSSRRYRSTFSFPGLSFNADRSIIASDFGKAMLEFVLPPLRFNEFGGLNLYASWVQASLFSSVLATQDDTGSDNRFANLGAQLDMKIAILSILESTFSLGYARAFDLNNGANKYDEWLISVKLLR